MARTIKLLGLCFTLQPHPINEVPASRLHQIGYVGFDGTDTVQAARWHGGGWLDHSRRPFAEPPVVWYSLEGPHGKA
jgi:hypothetical protein